MNVAAPITRPKAYSYLRFSTPEQAKGDSLRRQTEQAQAYAERHGLDLVEESYEDLGVSAFRGANADTGMLGEFRRAVEDGLIPRGSFLLVESFDRISRLDPWTALPILQSIINLGITVVTLSDDKVWDREGMRDNPFKIVETLLIMIRANEESKTKSQRVRAAWANKRKTASEKKLTARVPSWLRLTDDRKEFEILEDRAAVVRRIYALYVEGMGFDLIAKTLNREDVPPLDRGTQWHRSAIVKLLNSETPLGTYTPHTIEFEEGRKVRRPATPVRDYYPNIVDPEVNAAVKAKLAVGSPRGRHANSGTVHNILANLCRCSRCGGTVTMVNKGARDKRRLVCMKAKMGAGCSYEAIPYDPIEAVMIEHRDDWLLIQLEDQHPLAEALSVLEEQIAETNAKLLEVIGLRSPAARTERDRLDGELLGLQQEAQRLGSIIAETIPEVIVHRASKVQDALAAYPLDRAVVNSLLKQLLTEAIIGFDEGRVHFRWRHGAETSVMFKWVG